MLQNAYLLAKIGADTAENERNFAENLPKIGNYPPGQLPYGALNPDRAGGLVLRPLPVTERPLASLEQPQRYVRVSMFILAPSYNGFFLTSNCFLNVS